jgi:hypothetical protein
MYCLWIDWKRGVHSRLGTWLHLGFVGVSTPIAEGLADESVAKRTLGLEAGSMVPT